MAQGGAGPRLVTARARLGDTARGYLGQDDLGRLELYADAGTGLAGAVAVGPNAASWRSEVTLAIRAEIPVAIPADVVHAFPTYGRALETALRGLTKWGQPAHADQQEKGTGPLSQSDIETPEDDAIEEHQEVIGAEAVGSPRREVPFDVTRPTPRNRRAPSASTMTTTADLSSGSGRTRNNDRVRPPRRPNFDCNVRYQATQQQAAAA